MRRYHWVRLYALLLMVILFALTALTGIRGSFAINREAANQKSIVRSVQNIGYASDAIMKGLSQIAKAEAQVQYDQLLEFVSVEDDSRLSENDLENYFRMGYANKIRAQVGKNSSQICEKLNSFIREGSIANVSVYDNGMTVVEEETDADGNTTALRIKNVTLLYDDPVMEDRSDVLSYNIQFPDAVFHAGNDELFRYCMVARKGIYITGRTSSIIGDIFAGRHGAEECREAEIAYGETGTYGGLNILSTQVGIKADRIVSEADININGSFVIISPNNGQLNCYAQRMNEIEGFSKKSDYTLEGEYHTIRATDEGALDEYRDAVKLVDTSLADLNTISTYYDSDNDRYYNGKYRKLVTNSDVEIREDFTGIVATPSNVIIHKDVNFEGIILCGNRIYAMGNNNIVANASVARSVIASENNDEPTIKVKDYIGGMRTAGLTDPQYYVIPYR